MLISAPSSLYGVPPILSDALHITDIYTQLTDGTRDFTGLEMAGAYLQSENIKTCRPGTRFLMKQVQRTEIIYGDMSQNIDFILNYNDFDPYDYQNQILVFGGTQFSMNYSNFCCEAISSKNLNNVWQWYLLGIHEWN